MSHQATTPSEIKVLIDGKETRVKNGSTILQAARTLGITIPTLCSNPAVEPYGACRVCTVELKRGKRSRMVTACNYPIREEGLAIETKSVMFFSIALLMNCFERIPPTVIMGKETACFTFAAVSRL